MQKLEKKVSAVLVAAGSSTRMGFDKLSFDLGGETVVQRSIRAFAECPLVSEIVLVAGKNRAFLEQQAAACTKPVQVVQGGATRAESAKNGVLAAHGELVAVHDAARPFVSQAVITAALEAAAACGAAAPAVPVKDTVKRAVRGDGKTVPEQCMVADTPDRSTLYAVQTPQCFDRAAYLAALDELDAEKARLVTDDCSLFELTGRPVQLTQGDYANLKITTREDLPRAEQKEGNDMRIGHGYDVHRLVEDRKLILGGVEVPFEKGLLGHSDADVLAHAVMDAVTRKTTTKTHGIIFSARNGMLFITLPSGRSLAYVKPKIGENRFGGDCITYEGVGGTKKWERIDSYGPKFVENIVQATSRDILCYAMKTLRCCSIVMHIHDEVVIEADRRMSLQAVCDQMGRTPPWANGLQLRADGYETDFYKKD